MPDSPRQVLTPVIVPITLVLGVALVGTATGGPDILAAAVVAAIGLLLAYAWPHLLGLPSPNGVRAVLVVGVFTTTGAGAAGEGRDLPLLPVALAVTLVASFLHQLLRKDGRPRLVETLGGTMLGTGLLTSGACYLGVRAELDAPWLVLATVLPVLVAVLADLLLHAGPYADWALPVAVGVSAALGAGIALGESESVLLYFALAATACVVSHTTRQLLASAPSAGRWTAQLSIAAAALLSTGALPYVAAWVIDWVATR